MTTSARQQLIDYNLRDFLRAFELDRLPLTPPLLSIMMRRPARRVTDIALEYDHRVATEGLHKASIWFLQRFIERTHIYGSEHIPSDGPLLIVSNHPGVVDAMAIFASLQREDLRIVAKRNPVFEALPAISQHLIFTSDEEEDRFVAVREIMKHLRGNRAVLLFPAGQIEPDPALRTSASDALAHWSESIALLGRYVPHLRILPTLVSSVISPSAARSPITRLYAQPAKRDWIAATLMVMFEAYRDTTVDVRFGQPITMCDLHNPTQVMPAVQEAMMMLMRQSNR